MKERKNYQIKNFQEEDKREESELEGMVKGAASAAFVEEKSFEDLNFLNAQKLGESNDNEKIKSEIIAVHKKYKSIREKFLKQSIFLLRKFITLLASSISASLLMVSVAKKEFPDFIQNPEKNVKISWNIETKNEIENLASEYAKEFIGRFSRNKQKNVSEKFLEERFIQFVKQYAPDISIVFTESIEKSTIKKIEDNLALLLREGNIPRAYIKSRTIYYPQDSVVCNRLSDFISELAHYINGDYSFGRSMAYSSDLMRNNFKQLKTYKDPYSVEYQAHNVTEWAIRAYLICVDERFDVSFPEIFNVFQEYYRVCISKKSWEYSDYFVNYLLLETLGSFNFSEISAHKKNICKNIALMRDAVDEICVFDDKEIKIKIFEDLVYRATDNDLAILKSDNPNFHEMVKNILPEVKTKIQGIK